MLGHKVMEVMATHHTVVGTCRHAVAGEPRPVRLENASLIGGVDALEWSTVERAIEQFRPSWVINCIGIVKQAHEAEDPLLCIQINALFPHKLARFCRAVGVRVLQVSTDCVFSGRRGGYSEDDIPDPIDLYGRSKLLGEIDGEGALTLRTSIIGRGLRTRFGLVDWFLANRQGSISGYRHAVYSGLTTVMLSHTIDDLIRNHPSLQGVFQVGSEPISKYELLRKLRDELGLDTIIEPSDSHRCDRSFSSRRIVEATGYIVPNWDALIADLVRDLRSYNDF